MIKKLLILLVLFINLNIIAQTTYVPDDNFEQALIDLGYDSGTLDNSVLTANINTVTSLDVSSRSIEDLTGIEDFSALTTLRCFNNLLTSLDVTQNTALITLFCSSNLLTSLDVTQNTALEFLNFSLNQLTSLDVTQNTALESLNFAHNQLTSLDVTQNTALINLTCDSNQLTSLDVTQNTALEFLLCGDNPLTSLDVTQNTALTYLLCFHNQLTSLDITQNTALELLQCDNNQLTSLDVSQNLDLKELFCPQNQLTSLDVSQNTILGHLWCSFNHLIRLDLTQNTVLRTLQCRYNRLIYLNVKNGNNTLINVSGFNATNNLALACIEVDDAAWSTANWTQVDATSTFAEICSLSTDDFNLSNLSVYPNPTKGILNIELTNEFKKATVYNMLGERIMESTKKTIDVSNLTNAIYFIKIENTNGAVLTKRFIKY